MANWITIEDSLKARALAVARAKQEEQERIIKLLEDEKWHHMVIHMTNPPKRAHDYNCIGCRQIALIKGESNANISTI